MIVKFRYQSRVIRFIWLAVHCAMLAGCSPAKNSDDSAKKMAELMIGDTVRRSSFAAKYDVVWPELLSDRGKELLLTVDVQRQLDGKRVALDVWLPDVREEKGAHVLSGMVPSFVPLELEIEIDQQQLELVRSNRAGIWIAASISEVTPKREVRGDAGSASMEIVCYVRGKALGLAGGVEAGAKE